MSKIFRRSEYQHALNLARKARRRGDAASAERWLKHADRHIAAENRLLEIQDKARRREAERIAEYDREKQRRNEEKRARFGRETEERQARILSELEEELDRIAAMDDEDDENYGRYFPPSDQ